MSSTSSLSLSCSLIADPCAVELITSSVLLSPPLEPSTARYDSLLDQRNTSTSLNLQFAKSEQRIYGPYPRHENAQ